MLRGLLVAGRAATWEQLGFVVAEDRFAVGGVTIALTAQDEDGIRGWDVSGVEVGDVDGVAQVTVEPGGASEHPNGTVALDHLVVATPDLERTTEALGAAGIGAHRTVETVPGREGQRFRFFLLGTSLLEVIGPAVPRGDGPARFAGLAFATARLDALAAELGDRLGQVHDAVQPGRRIASVRDDVVGLGVPVAFMSPR